MTNFNARQYVHADPFRIESISSIDIISGIGSSNANRGGDRFVHPTSDRIVMVKNRKQSLPVIEEDLIKQLDVVIKLEEELFDNAPARTIKDKLLGIEVIETPKIRNIEV